MEETDGIISIGGRWWSFPGSRIASDSEFEWRDGKLYLHDGSGIVIEGIEVDNPEVLAVVSLPSAAERRLREVNLARLMLAIVDIVLVGDPMGLETTRDLSRELRHAYPELVDEIVG